MIDMWFKWLENISEEQTLPYDRMATGNAKVMMGLENHHLATTIITLVSTKDHQCMIKTNG